MSLNSFEFRTIRPEEADQAALIESLCFPPNEACKKESMLERVALAAECFLVVEDLKTGQLAGFLNGIATDDEAFRDDFFKHATLHNPVGANIMLLGLDVLHPYRKQGLASALMRLYVERETARGRKKLILTCLDEKVEMYEHMQFTDLGVCGSTWGGMPWHEMVRIL